MAKLLTFSHPKVNFLAITFEPVVRLSPNFESEKICMIHGLFAKAVCRKQVIHLGEKRSTWARMSCRCRRHTCPHENERERECVIFVLYYTLKSRISRKSNIRDFVVPASVLLGQFDQGLYDKGTSIFRIF